MELVQTSRHIAHVCQSISSRQYKGELRRQGVLQQLIVLADDVDGDESQQREHHALVLDAVLRFHKYF